MVRLGAPPVILAADCVPQEAPPILAIFIAPPVDQPDPLNSSVVVTFDPEPGFPPAAKAAVDGPVPMF